MDTQQLITLLIVAVAAFFLVRRLWKQAKGGEDACGGCGGGCGKPVNPNVRAAPQAKPLVTLGPPPPRRHTGGGVSGRPASPSGR
jgi:hypothetical protein